MSIEHNFSNSERCDLFYERITKASEDESSWIDCSSACCWLNTFLWGFQTDSSSFAGQSLLKYHHCVPRNPPRQMKQQNCFVLFVLREKRKTRLCLFSVLALESDPYSPWRPDEASDVPFASGLVVAKPQFFIGFAFLIMGWPGLVTAMCLLVHLSWTNTQFVTEICHVVSSLSWATACKITTNSKDWSI